MRPNQPSEVQVVEEGSVVDSEVDGDVLVVVCFLVLSKQMRPKKPSCVQEVEVAVCVGIDDFIRVLPGGSSPSRQSPNQPGYLHDDVEVGADVVVTVGAGAGVVACEVVVVDFSP